MMRRLFSYCAFVLGVLGTIACLIAIVALLSIGSQARLTTETVFERIDGALVVVHERAEQTAERVRDSAITTRTVAESLKQWAGRQAGQQIAEQLQVAETTDRLQLALQQADEWLEVSEASIGLVEEAVAVGNSLGAQMSTQSVEGLTEDIVSLRSELSKAQQVVENLHERAIAEEEVPEERIAQAVGLALRVAATLSAIDDRLDRVADQLSDVQDHARQAKLTALRWIRWAQIATVLLVAWIAVGQVALCCLAWRGFRSNPQIAMGPARST